MFEKGLNNTRNKRGQVTVFVIIAILLVVAVAAFFIIRNVATVAEIPANLEPVYNGFLACIQEDALVGISVLESQGGYIELPNFEPGSAHMPFSSQLNFLGNPVPYWYYVSGNNIQKEQVPSKTLMEEQLGDYVLNKIRGCVLDEYYGEGYSIILGDGGSADVTINSKDVEVNLDLDLRIERAEDTVLISDHAVVVDSLLGSLYDSAREIYEYEQETLFLENYGVDTLRLYAPVDGVELSCSPLIWSADEVFDELKSAIVANVLSLKVDNSDLTLLNEEDKYFVVDTPVSENVRFLTSSKWFGWGLEVNPDEDGILIAKPVGNQPGMAALGFCYVSYHFVYNVKYPVLVQVYSDSGEEIFQFPMGVVIQGNNAREPFEGGTAYEIPEAELCQYKNTLLTVNTYDTSSRPVDADISYQCFGEVCSIGSAEGGSLEGLFPQCVNGFILARAEGFEDTTYFINSTTQPEIVSILMNRVYEKPVSLKLDGKAYGGEAIVTFTSESNSATIAYPEQKTVELTPGQYEVQVFIYRNASINLEEVTTEECVEVPQTGVGGFFGLTEDECFDITIPEQTISQALLGGGIQDYYAAEGALQNADSIEINSDSLPTPESIDDLQENYILFESKGLDISLK